MSPSTGQAVSTSYGPPWGGIEGGGTTATGIDLHNAPHKLIVAADPRLHPMGERLKIWPNPFGDPSLIFTVADTGGAIKGEHFDFYDWRGRRAQQDWGVKPVRYTVVGRASPANILALKGSGGLVTGQLATTGGGGLTGLLQGPLTRALLYLALVGGGAGLAGYGLWRSANATSGGRLARVRDEAATAAVAA